MGMCKHVGTLLAALMLAHSCRAQLTAQTSTAPTLHECYDNATLLDRNNLPPMTVSVLIDIIRKIEQQNAIGIRQLAVGLLHTYRQDGMEYHPPTSASTNVLPYSPTYYTFYRHKLLLTKLLPSNNYFTFGNETVSSVLKCTLHHMLSSTIQTHNRGDEGTVCSMLAHYRALRVPRALSAQTTGDDDDVEILDDKFVKSANQNGRMRQFNTQDVETNINTGRFERQALAESACPLQDGVVQTRWGAVSAGSLIAGVAAGAEPQTVRVADLTRGSVTSHEDALAMSVDTRYPSTLTGDLAEVVLRQASAGLQTFAVGADGGWNSTQPPRYYFLRQRENMEMTDAEIRGGIDGLVLGKNFQQLTNTYSNLKLSTLLDMYYSPINGVQSAAYRACNRKTLLEQSTTTAELANEAYAFTVVLDTSLPLTGTIRSGLQTLANNAVTSLLNHVSTNLNDLSCDTTLTTTNDYRLKTNLYLVVDQSWQYATIYPAISYLLHSIEVDKYGSSVTLLNAANGQVEINTTFSLADFHSSYTLQRHQSLPFGVNLPTTFATIRTMALANMELERTHNYVGGNGTVLLFLINSLGTQTSDEEFVWEQARALNETVPDLRIIFATPTNQQGSLWRFVRDLADIVTVSLTSTGTNVENGMANVMERVNIVSRRVVNPLCGASWQEANSGTRNFVDYVEPSYINFYSVHPNYFYHSNENRRLRVERTGGGTGTLRVCYSRTEIQPRQTSNITTVDPNTNQAVTCQDIAATGTVEVDLSHACDGYGYIGACPPLYLSVQSVVVSNQALGAQCTEDACRFPYNIRYTVVVQEFGCYSNSPRVVASLLLLLACLLPLRQLF